MNKDIDLALAYQEYLRQMSEEETEEECIMNYKEFCTEYMKWDEVLK